LQDIADGRRKHTKDEYDAKSDEGSSVGNKKKIEGGMNE